MIADRDLPLAEKCPICNSSGTIKRSFSPLPISSVGKYSAIRRAGTDWNSLLKKIKRGSGEKNSIQTR